MTKREEILPYYQKNRKGALLSSFVPANTLIPVIETEIECPFCEFSKPHSKSEFLMNHVEFIHPEQWKKLKILFPILRSYLGK